jgi:hypothetical protein
MIGGQAADARPLLGVLRASGVPTSGSRSAYDADVGIPVDTAAAKRLRFSGVRAKGRRASGLQSLRSKR